MNKKFWVLYLLIFLMLAGCKTDVNNRKTECTSEYMVLVGEDPSIVDKIRNVDVLVIDASYFSKDEILLLKENNVSQIYSYLNIGSIEEFRTFYEDFEKYTLGSYENWPDEKWIDVSSPEWEEFIINECNELINKGVDGFFIDNVDVYYQYPNDNIYNGLVDILSEIKAMNKAVYINGGDHFIKRYIESGAKELIFDGVNQESVYTAYDFSEGLFLKSSKEDMQYYEEYLGMLIDRGYKVYVVEYSTDLDTKNKAYEYSKEHNFTCYVSDNIELRMNKD